MTEKSRSSVRCEPGALDEVPLVELVKFLGRHGLALASDEQGLKVVKRGPPVKACQCVTRDEDGAAWNCCREAEWVDEFGHLYCQSHKHRAKAGGARKVSRFFQDS